MEKFKMALIQMYCTFGDVKKNVEAAESKIRQAHENGAQFICMPESFNTGYYWKGIKEMADMAEPLDGFTISRMRTLAAELGVYIMAPIIQKTDKRIPRNTAVLIDDTGDIIGTHSKTHLVGDEQIYFERGQKYSVFKTKFGNIGMLVCYDISFPETARILALKGADIIIVPVACRNFSYYRDWVINNFRARALDNVLYVAGACMAGELPDSPFTGTSLFVSPIGAILNMAGVEEETILYQDIDIDLIHKERKENTVLIDRHPEDYRILSEL